MEFLCAELLEVAGESCIIDKKRLIKPNHIEIGLRNDCDFSRLFNSKTITESEKAPFIVKFLDKIKKTPLFKPD